MNWAYVIPTIRTGEASRVAEPSMDSDSFAGFYQRSAPPLWAYLARVSGNPTLADDLMQESYLRFLCANPPAAAEIDSRRYLFRIATNLLRDHWRRPAHSSIDELPNEPSHFTDHTARLDSHSILGPALAQMRPRDRQLLWLAHAEEYSHREIAEITGLATTSIRLLLFRARRKIAHLLEQQTNSHPTPAPDLDSPLAKATPDLRRRT